MARPAEVLYQRGGEGIIQFAGQQIPALAIRADRPRGRQSREEARAYESVTMVGLGGCPRGLRC